MNTEPPAPSEAHIPSSGGAQKQDERDSQVRTAETTVSALSAHICVLDDTGIILAVNQAWHDFAEANPPLHANVCEGASYLEVCDRAIGPEAAFAAAFAAGIRSVMSGEVPEFLMEYPCHSPTVKRWFIGHVTRFPGEGPARLVVAHENITARKLAQNNEAEIQHRYRAILETIPDLIWLKDPEGVYLSCNHRFALFFGANEEAITGHTDYDFVSREQADFFRANDRKTMEAGGPSVNEEWVTFASDGHRELLETIKTPLRDSQGHLVGVLGIGRNITDRKEAELERQKQLDELRRWYKVMLGRETRIIEFKREVNALLAEAEQPAKYGSAETHP
jgi:PAS domain S-box-containing protein